MFYRKIPSKKEIIKAIFLRAQEDSIKHLQKNKLDHLIPKLFSENEEMPYFDQPINPFNIDEDKFGVDVYKITMDQLIKFTKSKDKIKYLRSIGIMV